MIASTEMADSEPKNPAPIVEAVRQTLAEAWAALAFEQEPAPLYDLAPHAIVIDEAEAE